MSSPNPFDTVESQQSNSDEGPSLRFDTYSASSDLGLSSAPGDEEDVLPIANFIRIEEEFLLDDEYYAYLDYHPIVAASRKESVKWFHTVCNGFYLRPLTAYLAVNYMDRVLFLRRLTFGNKWMRELLQMACLSLAIKTEESGATAMYFALIKVFSLDDPRHQVKLVLFMELLILNELKWKLRAVTPFDFINSFSLRVDPSRNFKTSLLSRATKLILATNLVPKFSTFRPSSIAAASVFYSANEISELHLPDQARSVPFFTGMVAEDVKECCWWMQRAILRARKTRRRSSSNRALPFTINESPPHEQINDPDEPPVPERINLNARRPRDRKRRRFRE